ncbi:hypothetical protein ABTX77_07960 [Streptomyces sp. NPDC097704]|uniref:hypothetical protein n=1 Tax=Streptomyces sp. NPDC097704 TaxID=3157101 RepID=UPI003327B980
MLNRIRRAITRTRERYAQRLGARWALPPTAYVLHPDVIPGEDTTLVRPYVPAAEHLLTPAKVL